MQSTTEFQGPTPADYANVSALNAAYIEVSFSLKPPQRGRLADVPFLMFSLREDDIEWWDKMLSSSPQDDFLIAVDSAGPELRQLQTAALAFLWHLAQQNPYALRVVTGAGTRWCELIAELPLFVLLDRVAGCDGLLQPRLSDRLSARLLADGTSAREQVRRSSHLRALQSLLTHVARDIPASLPAAACRFSGGLSLHDKKP